MLHMSSSSSKKSKTQKPTPSMRREIHRKEAISHYNLLASPHVDSFNWVSDLCEDVEEC